MCICVCVRVCVENGRKPVKAAVHGYMDISNCKEASGQTADNYINCIQFGEIVVNKPV